MKITSGLFETYLKCPTKCYLRARGEIGPGNRSEEWLRIHNGSYGVAELKRLSAGKASHDYVTGELVTKNLHEVKWTLAYQTPARASERRGRPAQFIPIRLLCTNKLTGDDKLVLAFDALVLSKMIDREVNIGKIIHGDNHATRVVKTAALAEVNK